MYRVLWFDDEFETKGANTTDNANEEFIELLGVSNATKGIEMLTSSPENYDAILLDGLFFMSDSENENFSDVAFREVSKTILQLKAQGHHFPWFVYSGQKEFVKSKHNHQSTFEDENFGMRTYDKNSDQDQIDLWQDIKAACNEKASVRIRFKYDEVLSICDDNYIGAKQYNRVFKLLECIEDPKTIKNSEDMLNPMRKVMEALFNKLNELGIIPDDIFDSHGKINGSSYFLSMANSDYEYHQELIHPMVAENIYRLLNITQDASHNDGNKLRSDDYLAENKVEYLYLSTIYLLLDILAYMKPFIKTNNNRDENLKRWSLKESSAETILHEGLIAQDEHGNYYCDHYHLNYSFVHERFSIGQKIIIVQEDINSNSRTNEYFSHYAVKFKTTT
jgi:hypothetical protein